MKLFSFKNHSSMKEYQVLLQKINFISDELKGLTSAEIKQRFNYLKQNYKNQPQDTKLIIETFGLIREVSGRTLGLRHYDTQILCGLALNDGKIAEMKTGEGKTLAATLAACLNAINEKGVHLITVNDYLAKRDKEAMQSIYESLGLTVGFIQKEMTQSQRKANYACDITYVTNSELGFDFLRDATASSLSDTVLRPLNFGIVDEVDSILIDEARTPLILSSSTLDSNNKYELAKTLIQHLRLNIDYEIENKSKGVILTDKGIELAKALLRIEDLYNITDPWFVYIVNALKAEIFYLKNRDYIVLENKVAIIDQLTGRLTPDRRWSQGLHQAVEVKENLAAGNDLKTIASITYQSFFSLYPKLAGMTGTAKTSEEEFENIYKLKIEIIPTKNPIQRKDHEDLVFLNRGAKWEAVTKKCIEMYKKGRPILVGTTNLEDSELVSEWLINLNIPHQILNAKPEYIKQESDIIAQAGRKHAITIATNMAGRGTDILLGGNPKNMAKSKLLYILERLKNLKKLNSNLIFKNKDIFEILQQIRPLLNDTNIQQIKKFLEKLAASEAIKPQTDLTYLVKKAYILLVNNYQKACDQERQEVKALGGLYVLGTERNESIRIDNQLRGRSGRQGDPGESQLFVCLEDTLYKNFGGDNIIQFLKKFQFETNEPLKNKSVNESLNKIQEKGENHFAEIRIELRKYDTILDSYRNWAVQERRQILEIKEKDITSIAIKYFRFFIEKNVNIGLTNIKSTQRVLFFNLLNQKFFSTELFSDSSLETQEIISQRFFISVIISFLLKYYQLERIFPFSFNQIQKKLLLKIFDEKWSEYLEKTSALAEVIGWQNYAQKDPIVEYKAQCYNLFSEFLSDIGGSYISEFLETDIL